MSERVDGVVVEQRLPRRRSGCSGELEIGVGYLAPVVLGAHRLNIDRTKEAKGQRAAVALRARLCRRAIEETHALTFGIELVGARLTGSGQTAGIGANIGA